MPELARFVVSVSLGGNLTRRASAPAKANALFGIDAKSIDDAQDDDEGDEDAGAEGVCVCWISFEFVVRAVGEKKDKRDGIQALAVKALQGACQ